MDVKGDSLVHWRRAVLAWALLLIGALCAVTAFATYGDRVIRAVEAQRLLGRAADLLRANRVDEAITMLMRAVQVKPDSFPARRPLVRTLLRSGRFTEAAECAQAGIEHDRGEAALLLDEVRRETAPSRAMYSEIEGARE